MCSKFLSSSSIPPRVFVSGCACWQHFTAVIFHLGVLDRHDDSGGQDQLLPGLADVEDMDTILVIVALHKHKERCIG